MKKKVCIVGSGPAALMLAAQLDEHRFDVSIWEKNAACGRKFLVAGDGGFNLTHSEPVETMITRYTPAGFLDEALRHFTNEDLRHFLKQAGIPTFAGSSKRVFPEKGIKPIDVLNAFLELLKKKNVQIHLKQEWVGWENDSLVFIADGKRRLVESDLTVFALGGASWPVTGSTGSWVKFFEEKNIRIVPFQSSNCAMQVQWPEPFIGQYEGRPLKNIAVHCDGKTKKGELVLTRFGIEGGSVYFHSPAVRKQLNANGHAEISIDLRPDLSLEEVELKLASGRNNLSRTALLKKEFGFDEIRIALLKLLLPKTDFTDNPKTAKAIKGLPISITGLAPLEEAISSAGGIATDELDADFQIRKLPRNFAIGEMTDWDAPTGGYLLQACFSMGVLIAKKLNTFTADLY